MKNIFKKRYIAIILLAVSLSSFGIVGAEVLSESLWADTEMCSGVDPKSGLTCDEIEENPEQDVYYVVDGTHLDDNIWKDSHQDLGTVRWDLAHTKFIVKYDVSEIPRQQFGLEGALGNPMNNDEIRAYLLDPLNGFYFDEDAPIVEPILPPLPPEELLPPEIEVPPVTEEPPIIDEPVVPEPVDPTAPTDPAEPPDPTEPEVEEPTGPDSDVIIPPDPEIEEDTPPEEGEVNGASDDSSEDQGGGVEDPSPEDNPTVEEQT